MTKQAGTWIDREHAILIVFGPTGHEMRKFTTGESEPFPPSTESRAAHSYTPNDFQPEKRAERKQTATRKHMYDELLAAIHDVDSLIIFGPGEAKKEFASYLNSHHRNPIVVQMETADKMTDPQLVAKVRDHFRTLK